jgi:drug/metabolite transporter (DMT)-like permease
MSHPNLVPVSRQSIQMSATRIQATWMGCLALGLWSGSAVLVTQLRLPPFETLLIVSIIALIFTSTKLTYQRRWHTLVQPKTVWLGYGLGLACNNISYYLAFHYASPIEVDLITWLWPAASILILSRIQSFKCTRYTLLSIGLCLTALLLILPLKQSWSHAWIGYGFAFSALFSWCFYVFITQKHPDTPPELAPLSLGLSLPVTFILHKYFETFMTPTLQQWGLLIMLGAGSATAAFVLWDHGIKKGHAIQLCHLAYLTPLLSVLWLVLTGQEALSWSLGLASVLILASNILYHLTQNHPQTTHHASSK